MMGSRGRRQQLSTKSGSPSVRAVDLTPELLDKYRAQRVAEGARQATVNRELQTLRRACHKGRVPVIQFELPAERNARQRFYSADEAARLRTAARQHSLEMTTFIDMALVYGWRRGELLGLRVSNVNLAAGVVRLDTSKNHTAREVPITPDLNVLLRALVDGQNATDYLFSWNGTFGRRGRPSARLQALLMLICTTCAARQHATKEL